MSFIPNQPANTGSFVPTTNVWDTGEIYAIESLDDQLRELLVRLYQNLNLMATVLNNKESGYYPLQEFLTSALYFNPNSTDVNKQRNEFLKVINTGALGAGATTKAHGITVDANWNLVYIYGSATDNIGNNYYPMNFTQNGGTNNLSLRMDATDVIISNGTGVNFTSSIVIIKYLKN